MIQGLWNKDQRNLAPLSVPGASSKGSIRVVSGSGFRYVVPFPYRLHEMLSDEKHDSSIVSWSPSGRHFKVHDPQRFVESVIPSAFKQKSLKSFQRQLHLYGFQRVHEGVDKGAYFHEKFRRDDRDMCLSITRTKAPKRSRATATIRKNNKFVPKSSIFQSGKHNTQGEESKNNKSTFVARSINIPPATISPTIFDAEQKQSSRIPDTIRSSKGPLHKATVTPPFLPTPYDQQSSSSSLHSSRAQNVSFTQKTRGNQHSEGSIADTCRYLLNAGVPVSAFDPVAINDFSKTPFAAQHLSIPQLVTSTPTISPAIPQQPTPCPSNDSAVAVEKKSEQLPPSNEFSTEMNSLISAELPLQNADLIPFGNDPLLNDLLPGENMSFVDDSLWAL